MGVERDFIADLALYRYPLSELVELQRQVEETIEQAKLAEIDKARETLAQTAENLGIPMSDLIGKLTSAQMAPQDTLEPRQRTVVGIPKYFHPSNGRTWTGKGRQPKWVVEHIESGGTLEGLIRTDLTTIAEMVKTETLTAPTDLPDPEEQ